MRQTPIGDDEADDQSGERGLPGRSAQRAEHDQHGQNRQSFAVAKDSDRLPATGVNS